MYYMRAFLQVCAETAIILAAVNLGNWCVVFFHSHILFALDMLSNGLMLVMFFLCV